MRARVVPQRRNRIRSGIERQLWDAYLFFFFRVLLIITAQGEGGDSNAFACPETRLILVRSEADLLAGRRRFDGSATVTEGL